MLTALLLNAARRVRCVALFALVALSCRSEAGDSYGGVVAAATPEAVQAGIAALELGGNAIDAAVAVSFALAVTEPAMSGLGGQTQILMARPGEHPVAINGTSFSPRATDPDATVDDVVGHRLTTVPSTVRVLSYAWRQYGSGTVSWSDLLQPAIGYAEEGFAVGEFRHKVWLRHEAELRNHETTSRLFLTPDGRVPAAGETFRQPVLASTLRRLAEVGADDFYEGEIARSIAEDMSEHGGWVSAADLSDLPDPVELPALAGSYRGYDVFSLPPPGSGWVVLQALNLLERTPAHELAPGSPTRVLRLAEALRIAHRSSRIDPVADLVDYEVAVDQRIDKATAERLLGQERGGSGETTHFTVVDADGMVVSVSASINAYFGARVANPELGFLYNDYMREFEYGRPGHPFAVRESAMPYSSMSPTVVVRDGRPVLGLGSPGSARIISAVAQVAQLWIDGHLPIAGAVAEPRVHVVPEDGLYLENAALPDSLLSLLDAVALRIVAPAADLALRDRNAYYGGVHAVALENGRWGGAADPRRDGTARRAAGSVRVHR